MLLVTRLVCVYVCVCVRVRACACRSRGGTCGCDLVSIIQVPPRLRRRQVIGLILRGNWMCEEGGESHEAGTARPRRRHKPCWRKMGRRGQEIEQQERKGKKGKRIVGIKRQKGAMMKGRKGK